ncbi:MAG: 50S ribosomal protein L23 [Euryarchaeota archaeon]|nr:50S ribosomal protein L23 [Euryarchaeota archaeon]
MSKDPYTVVYHPHVTEKTMNLMSEQNKLEFIVDRRANKKDVKLAVEALFEVKVQSVNTFINSEGKHAIVKLTKDYSAEDLGMRIGVF